MRKFICLALVAAISFGVLSGCGGNGETSESRQPQESQSSGETSSTKNYEIDEEGNYVYELFLDPKFETGFSVGAAGRGVDSYPLDYNMLLPGSETYNWLCSQWGCKYGFGDSYGNALITGHEPYEVECIDGEYQFECYDAAGKLSHALRVNPTIGKLTMDMNASVEYEEDGVIVPRTNGNEYWCHILLSQGFVQQPLVQNLKKLVLTADVTINKCTDMHPAGTYNPNMHAAQFLMYLVVKSTKDTEYMWFGIPFFDNRYPFMEEHTQIDGVENKFLYQVPASAFAPDGSMPGTTMNIELDLIPYFERALTLAQTQYDRFNSSTADDLYVSGMNVGWELPGVFDVSASIQNYSLKAVAGSEL